MTCASGAVVAAAAAVVRCAVCELHMHCQLAADCGGIGTVCRTYGKNDLNDSCFQCSGCFNLIKIIKIQGVQVALMFQMYHLHHFCKRL